MSSYDAKADKSAGLRDRLIEDLQDVVNDLTTQFLNDRRQVFDNKNGYTKLLLLCVERIFTQGMKESTFFKSRNLYEVVRAAARELRGYLPLKTDFNTVDTLALNKTGKGRAWIRQALNQGHLSDSIYAIAGNDTFCQAWFEVGSVMSHPNDVTKVHRLIESLTSLSWSMNIKDRNLENEMYWDKDPDMMRQTLKLGRVERKSVLIEVEDMAERRLSKKRSQQTSGASTVVSLLPEGASVASTPASKFGLLSAEEDFTKKIALSMGPIFGEDKDQLRTPVKAPMRTIPPCRGQELSLSADELTPEPPDRPSERLTRSQELFSCEDDEDGRPLPGWGHGQGGSLDKHKVRSNVCIGRRAPGLPGWSRGLSLDSSKDRYKQARRIGLPTFRPLQLSELQKLSVGGSPLVSPLHSPRRMNASVNAGRASRTKAVSPRRAQMRLLSPKSSKDGFSFPKHDETGERRKQNSMKNCWAIRNLDGEFGLPSVPKIDGMPQPKARKPLLDLDATSARTYDFPDPSKFAKEDEKLDADFEKFNQSTPRRGFPGKAGGLDRLFEVDAAKESTPLSGDSEEKENGEKGGKGTPRCNEDSGDSTSNSCQEYNSSWNIRPKESSLNMDYFSPEPENPALKRKRFSEKERRRREKQVLSGQIGDDTNTSAYRGGPSTGVILTLPENLPLQTLMKQQGNECFTCGQIFLDSLETNRCSYTGKLYCRGCFGQHSTPVPSRLLHLLDADAARVSENSYNYLVSMNAVPCLPLSHVPEKHQEAFSELLPILEAFKSLAPNVTKAQMDELGRLRYLLFSCEQDKSVFGHLRKTEIFGLMSIKDTTALLVDRKGTIGELQRLVAQISPKVK